jgi:mannose-6-phosphate isomerase-like protein (cupin superfamily)
MIMKHIETGTRQSKFEPLASTRDCQAAIMVLRPGAASDAEPDNEHPHCEQWLFVVSGAGQATVGKRRHALRRLKLRRNSLLVIEKGELHQIKNTGRRPLRTINFYVPPAYDADGDVKKQAAKRTR